MQHGLSSSSTQLQKLGDELFCLWGDQRVQDAM